MLSGVTRETRVLCSKLCSARTIMLTLCRTKVSPPPHPHSPAPEKKNIPSLSFSKLLLDNKCSVKPYMGRWSLEAWHKEVTRPSIIPKPLGMSLRYQVTKIFPPLPTLYIPEWVAGKLCIHFSQFLETTALCCKNIRQYYASIMPTVPDIALCSKLCRHNPIDPTQDKGGVPGPSPRSTTANW